jgi:hypothetical protein
VHQRVSWQPAVPPKSSSARNVEAWRVSHLDHPRPPPCEGLVVVCDDLGPGSRIEAVKDDIKAGKLQDLHAS